MIVMDNVYLKDFQSDGNSPASAAAASSSLPYEQYMNSGMNISRQIKNSSNILASPTHSSSAGTAMGMGEPTPPYMGMGMGTPMMQGSNGSAGVGLMMGAVGQDYELTEEDLMPEEFVPGKCDVICQRGKECFEHAGNRKFRTIIDRHLDTYMKVKSRQQKSKIVTNIVDHIQKSAGEDGGGFVRKDLLTRRWFKVSDKLAREKVGQALRDAIKSRRSAEKKKKESTNGSSSPASGSSPTPPSRKKDAEPVRGLLNHKLGLTPLPNKKQQPQLSSKSKQTTQMPPSATGLDLAPGTNNSEIWMPHAFSAGEAAASFLRRSSLDFFMPLQHPSQQSQQQLMPQQQQQTLPTVPFSDSRFGTNAGTATSFGSTNLDDLEPRPLSDEQQQQLDSIFNKVAAAGGGPSSSSSAYPGENVTSSSSLGQLQQQLQDLQNLLNQQQGGQQNQLLPSTMDQQIMVETGRRLSLAGGGAAGGIWSNDVMGDFGLGNNGSSLGRRLSLVAAAASLNNNNNSNSDGSGGLTNPLDLSNSATSLFFPTNQSNTSMLRSLQQQGYGTSNNDGSGTAPNQNINPYSGI